MQGDFCLVLGQTGDAIAMQKLFRTGAYFLTLVADELEVEGVWVAR